MTFEEAKKILKKEGFHLVLAPKVINQNGAIREFEKPEVCEAIKVANANRWTVGLSPIEWDEREARLKKEYEENHIKCGDPIPGSPALKEAASQFNDALLDEQGKKIKHLTKKITRLNKIIHKKNEELRLSKIREKNLAELGLKYVGENEKLKKKLADKIVDEIDARALKSAESALAYKEKVIAEKDEVIADLGNELAATKKELEAFKESYKRRIKEDSEHFEHIQKICNAGLQKWLIESEYLEKDKPFRFPNHDIASGKENKKPRIPTPEEPKHDKSFENFVNETIDDYNRIVTNFGCIGSKDGNGIIDQMVRADFAEEGGDKSATIVECGKDIDDVFEEIKRLCQE